MAHRNFRGRVSQSQRRKRLWADLNVPHPNGTGDIAGTRLDTFTTLAAGGTVVLASFPSSGAPALLESTILRIRGYVEIPKSTLSDAGAAATGTVFAFGIGLVSEDAATAAAVPNPATGAGGDWDGWMFLRSSTEVALDIQGTVMDIKAMRKWESGQALVFVAGMASDNLAGDASASFTYSARGLFLLP